LGFFGVFIERLMNCWNAWMWWVFREAVSGGEINNVWIDEHVWARGVLPVCCA
jgi:hypothetical protein